ncbi:c-type cytochrome [Maribacter sp. TH_r10]|uniref:c-type cytochrome n=1 Tax=Maribacter sp. TH_r10 TaxID=3082086 RepID=UPI0029543B7D|nr:c-type cytochrome [Maribacter sp. TH_r10]MDV7139379.1 c-type cytochrome [Maribacter sp. TH_r10]
MKDESSYLIKKLVRQITICCSLIVLIATIALLFFFDVFSKEPAPLEETMLIPIASKYDISLLDDSKENTAIKYGYQLFVNSPKYIGPDNEEPDKAYSGNRLACNNCHLKAGTKPFSAPLIGIINRFPQYRGRENKIGTIQERINGCMERSMNGSTLPPNGKEMQAFVKYLTWLSRFTPEDGKIFGQGFVKIQIPERKVNLAQGKDVFDKNCVVCHGKNGQGVKMPDSFTYQYPPLWGNDSYNNGAGMTRVITAAQFIKANMPLLTTYDSPLLSDEEAYDVAGYINQQIRPIKQNREYDFPDLKRKPVSTPYPPYADSFSMEQHQMGPFQPIMAFYKEEYNMNKSK